MVSINKNIFSRLLYHGNIIFFLKKKSIVNDTFKRRANSLNMKEFNLIRALW